MIEPLIRKLSMFAHLDQVDRAGLAEAFAPPQGVTARCDVIDSADDPQAINVILEGWACRSRQFADGRKQIASLLLPGDVFDSHGFLPEGADHTISALTPVLYAQIPGAAFQKLISRSAILDRAFRREALATIAIQREWTVSLGCRSAIERMAHLFCELYARLSAVGLAKDNACPLPLTQHDLARALGQTSVHINRTLQELRAQGLITLRSRRLTTHDLVRLAEIANFDPSYLHFTVRDDRNLTSRGKSN